MRANQHTRQRNGQYDFGPRCYGCRKPAGDHYCSHPLTDCQDANGANWGDIALVLCRKCAKATLAMTTVAQFEAYRTTQQINA